MKRTKRYIRLCFGGRNDGEETGKISIALNGSLTRNLSRESLAKALKKIMSQKQETNEKIDKIMFWRTK